MDKAEYDEIKERLGHRQIPIPNDILVAELNTWITGYGACQMDIMSELEHYAKEKGIIKEVEENGSTGGNNL